MNPDDLRESDEEEQDDQDDQDDRDDGADEQAPESESKDEESNVHETHTETKAGAAAQRLTKQNRVKPRSGTPPQTRSHTSNHPQTKRWRSANAFINFVQDYKKDNPDPSAVRNIFQICGDRWKTMSDEQKQPYIAAANTVKRLKQRKTGGELTEVQQMKKSVGRVSKRKAETKRKETNQKRSKVILLSDSDTDTANDASMGDADSF